VEVETILCEAQPNTTFSCFDWDQGNNFVRSINEEKEEEVDKLQQQPS